MKQKHGFIHIFLLIAIVIFVGAAVILFSTKKLSPVTTLPSSQMPTSSPLTTETNWNTVPIDGVRPRLLVSFDGTKPKIIQKVIMPSPTKVVGPDSENNFYFQSDKKVYSWNPNTSEAKLIYKEDNLDSFFEIEVVDGSLYIDLSTGDNQPLTYKKLSSSGSVLSTSEGYPNSIYSLAAYLGHVGDQNVVSVLGGDGCGGGGKVYLGLKLIDKLGAGCTPGDRLVGFYKNKLLIATTGKPNDGPGYDLQDLITINPVTGDKETIMDLTSLKPTPRDFISPIDENTFYYNDWDSKTGTNNGFYVVDIPSKSILRHILDQSKFEDTIKTIFIGKYFISELKDADKGSTHIVSLNVKTGEQVNYDSLTDSFLGTKDFRGVDSIIGVVDGKPVLLVSPYQ